MERTENEVNYSRGQEFENRSGSTLSRVKVTLADQLARAAQALHQRSTQEVEYRELANVGHRTADWLERSANYVREVEPQRLRTDLETQIRRNPGRSLLIAGLAGLVIGRMIRRG